MCPFVFVQVTDSDEHDFTTPTVQESLDKHKSAEDHVSEPNDQEQELLKVCSIMQYSLTTLHDHSGWISWVGTI